MKFDSIGISRHRIGSDGIGVTTLVGGFGCPLDCKYCLNPQCKLKPAKSFTVKELFEAIDIDSLYFSATGGGVCFGGGEPLLQAKFICEFLKYAKEKGRDWKFTLETCLSVPIENLTILDGLIDYYIVDIKDMDEKIYREYTKKSRDDMINCLLHLRRFKDIVKVKIPQIPEFNNKDSIRFSKAELKKMGFENFEIFRYLKYSGRKGMKNEKK